MSTKKDLDHMDGIKRRSILKALAGVPVLGALGFEALRKQKYLVSEMALSF